MVKQKKYDRTIITLVVIGLVALAGGIYAGANYFNVGGSGSDETDLGHSYADKLVKKDLAASSFFSGTDVNPTFYIYEMEGGDVVDSEGEEVDNVKVSADSAPSGYIDTGTATDGVYTMQEKPGKYFVRAELSDFYTVYKTVEVPESGDVALTHYNDAPETATFDFKSVYTPSLSDWDLGVTGDESAGATVTADSTLTIDSDKSYQLSEVKLQEDDVYSFATDSDGDNTYDEGVSEISVAIQGEEYTLFKESTSIDEFAGDDTARINFEEPIAVEDLDTLSMRVEVTSDAFSNSTGDADEALGDGEDIVDDVIFIDTQGNSATADVTG